MDLVHGAQMWNKAISPGSIVKKTHKTKSLKVSAGGGPRQKRKAKAPYSHCFLGETNELRLKQTAGQIAILCLAHNCQPGKPTRSKEKTTIKSRSACPQIILLKFFLHSSSKSYSKFLGKLTGPIHQ